MISKKESLPPPNLGDGDTAPPFLGFVLFVFLAFGAAGPAISTNPGAPLSIQPLLPVSPGAMPQNPAPFFVPEVDLEGLEPAVASHLRLVRRRAVGVLESDPGGAEATATLGELAQVDHAYGLFDAARTLYHELLRRAPADPRWPHLLGLAEVGSGDLAAAETTFRQALAVPGCSPAVVLHLGRVLYELGRFEEAATILEPPAQAGRDPAAIAFLGEVELAADRPARAAELLDLALALEPRANRLHFPLGQAYRTLGDTKRAEQEFQLAGQVGLRPIDALVDRLESLQVGEVARTLRGRRAYSAGDFAAATREFQGAVAAAPNSPGARVNLGTALAAGGDKEAALGAFREALRLDPNHAGAHYNLGALLQAEGNTAEALAAYRAAAAADPADQAPRLALSQLLALLGRDDEALTELGEMRARLADPPEEAWLEAAQLELNSRRMNEVRALLEDGVKQKPRSAQIARALIRWLAQAPDPALRDGAAALEAAQRLLEIDEHPETLLVLAAAFAENNRCEEAVSWIDEAITRTASTEAELRQRLEQDRLRYSRRPCRWPAER